VRLRRPVCFALPGVAYLFGGRLRCCSEGLAEAVFNLGKVPLFFLRKNLPARETGPVQTGRLFCNSAMLGVIWPASARERVSGRATIIPSRL
jgi:hypothetical protein